MLGLANLLEPIKGSIVDCLCNIEAKVEASVIGASKDQHELILLVLYLRYSQFWVLAFQIVRIDERGLMPKELLTRGGVLREKSYSFFLDDLFVLVIDRIPKLRLPLMDEIDPRKVEVFSVPAKEGLPAANIAIRRIDSFYLGFKCIGKK